MSEKDNVVSMNFTLNELVSMRDVLQNVFSAKLPVKVSFRLQKFLKLVNSEYDTFEKLRLELFKQFGEEKEDQMVVRSECLEEFTQEMNDLLLQEVETQFIPSKVEDVVGKLSLSTIEAAKIVKLFDISGLTPSLEEVVFTPHELVSMREAMQKLFEVKLPIEISYLLAQYFLVAVNGEFEKFEQKRFDLFQKYGQEAENGQMTVKPEFIDEFTENLNVLLNEPVAIMLQKVKLDDLEGKVELTAIEASLLEKVLTE